MKTIDVLSGIDLFDEPRGIQMARQRQLHEDAVDRRIRVQAGDEFVQVCLGCRCREVVRPRLQSAGFAGPALVPDVNRGCGVVAHENDG